MHRTWCPSTSALAVALLASLSYLTASPAVASPQVAGGIVGTIPQQAPPRDRVPAPEPAGTGRLTVQVVAADSGAPVKRAQVQLTGVASQGRPAGSAAPGAAAVPPGGGVSAGTVVLSQGGVVTTVVTPAGSAPGRVQRAGETDASGRVEFAGLPGGSYTLILSPASGYVRPRQSPSVQLKDGEDGSLALRLDRAGAITGHVLDESGDPIARAQVLVMQRVSSGGAFRIGSSGVASTDDLGQYRVFDLVPGDYYVAASYRGAFSGLLSASAGPRIGYVPTFYANSGSVDTAQLVHVTAGQDTPGVDIALLRGKLGRVLGTATDSIGNPIGGGRGGAYVTLAPRQPDQMRSVGGATARPDGTFVISDVPPGDYYLVATASRGEGSAAEREGAFVPVSVNGDEVTASIQTNAGATLSGRIVVEGTTPPAGAPGALPGLTATLSPTGRGSAAASRLSIGVRPSNAAGLGPAFSMGKSAVASETNTFEVTGVRGSVLLTVSSPMGTLKEVRRGGEDISGTPLELAGTERINDIVIVVTNDVGTISGSVTNDRGEPAGGAWVIIFADDPTRWFVGSPFVRTTRTMQGAALSSAPGAAAPGAVAAVPGGSGAPRSTGPFLAGRLVAGRYLVVAIDEGDNPMVPAYDAETLAKLRPQATGVTVTPGQTVNVDVRTLKPPS
jgi:hypothetical protein